MFKKMIFSLFGITFSVTFSSNVGAHGTEIQHQNENIISQSFLLSIIVLGILSVLGICALLLSNFKIKTAEKKARGIWKKRRLYSLIFSVIFLVSLLIVIITGQIGNQSDKDTIEFMDIHGLGYTNQGAELVVPSHDGLKIYKNGTWTKGDGEGNDYMGFSMVNDGFYSSGHPGKDSTLKNPLGIVKSTDMGKTIHTLNFYGEVDFHGLSAGYESHSMYVIAAERNSKMGKPGLYFSGNEGKTWSIGKMDGVSGQLTALSAHPDKSSIVAVATDQGIFLSKDYGKSFSPIYRKGASAIAFSNQGSLYGASKKIVKINIESFEQQEIEPPSIKSDDVISYIAVNPANENELAMTTMMKDIFQSNDSGDSWNKIAVNGKGEGV
ncbi:F510_1955 family glycosylhydrolase [Falsibacillus pallidus]|uniref:F510_1955 family glycosylhydrolase n=1 Tax=Falsibacillus pallidus TaxID=493781 RepID=UPI003D972A81